MPCYLTPKQDDFNRIPELQVCIAEALYDIESILSDPAGYPYKEIVKLRDQIVSNLERAWELTGRSEDQLTAVMVQISQVVARGFKGSGVVPDTLFRSHLISFHTYLLGHGCLGCRNSRPSRDGPRQADTRCAGWTLWA